MVIYYKLPARNPDNKEEDGNHVTLVPVVLNVQFELFQDVHLFVCEKTLLWGV